MTVTINGDGFKSGIAAILGSFRGAVQQALNEAGKAGEASVKTSTRFHDVSGNLRSKTRTMVMGDFVRTLTAPTAYAGYVQWGNAPNGVTGARIYPKRAKALRFVSGGATIFRKSVASHGPLPFMTDASSAIEKALPSMIDLYVGGLWRA